MDKQLTKILECVIDEARAGEMPDGTNIAGAIEMIKDLKSRKVDVGEIVNAIRDYCAVDENYKLGEFEHGLAKAIAERMNK